MSTDSTSRLSTNDRAVRVKNRLRREPGESLKTAARRVLADKKDPLSEYVAKWFANKRASR